MVFINSYTNTWSSRISLAYETVYRTLNRIDGVVVTFKAFARLSLTSGGPVVVRSGGHSATSEEIADIREWITTKLGLEKSRSPSH